MRTDDYPCKREKERELQAAYELVKEDILNKQYIYLQIGNRTYLHTQEDVCYFRHDLVDHKKYDSSEEIIKKV